MNPATFPNLAGDATPRFVQVNTPEQLHQFAFMPELPHLDPDQLRRDAPQAHWLVVDKAGVVTGQASLWWKETPPHDNFQVGLIGHYAVANSLAANQLLGHVCEQLRRNGCTLAVAPMDGNTWKRYRFVIASDPAPSFWLEPQHPPEWPAQLVANGFYVLAEYRSGLNENLAYEDPAVTRAGERLEGITLRPLDPARLDDELQRIYEVTTASFQHNFLYTHISETQFAELYRPLLSRLQPDLILLAESGRRCLGYVFMAPDFLQLPRGGIDTAILKTVAVLPERAHAGLGTWLVAKAQMVARDLGYRKVIHALMHDSNFSRNISSRYARVIRRYALFARRL